ncbi:MAG TPA: antitoxin Xre-like helix-turn-helix domain-containing protein [Salinisphaeraceae bacterium]|nr:antitoxin Xre-like helix-turn-helix domain-containing protein [Salinisphaeraceae bacterium]
MMVSTQRKGPPPSQQEVLRDALLRAADFLGLTTRELAGIVGVSAATLTRLRRGSARLEPNGKPWELARLFVKLVVGLGTLTGTDEQAARQWLDHYNHDLDAIPRERIRSIAGLADTVAYVEQFVHRP